MSGSDPSLPPPAAEKAGRGQFPRKQHQRDREMGGGGSGWEGSGKSPWGSCVLLAKPLGSVS